MKGRRDLLRLKFYGKIVTMGRRQTCEASVFRESEKIRGSADKSKQEWTTKEQKQWKTARKDNSGKNNYRKQS